MAEAVVSSVGLRCWPFCWWVAVVIDHNSRRAIGFAVFPKRPTPLVVSTFLGKAISITTTPKYLICDQDRIFTADNFKRWLKRKQIKPRYGAAGQHGSIAVVERFIRTRKDEGIGRIMVPARCDAIRREIRYFIEATPPRTPRTLAMSFAVRESTHTHRWQTR